MISFEFPDLKKLYDALTALDKQIKPTELFIQEISKKAGLEIITEAQFKKSEFIEISGYTLPAPLKEASFTFSVRDGLYSSSSYISPDYKFANSSETIEKIKSKINDEGVVKTSEGLLLTYSGIPMFALKKSGDRLSLLCGKSGTSMRKLGNFEQFSIDMEQYSKILGRIINCCYDSPPNIRYQIFSF